VSKGTGPLCGRERGGGRRLRPSEGEEGGERKR